MDKIILAKPAKRWRDAFPIGNGHMGMMVYGGIKTERLDISENTFFSGQYKEDHDKQHMDRAFYEMREQIENGAYKQAHKTAKGFIGERHDYGTNLPVGTLEIEMESLANWKLPESLEENGSSAYQRELSLTTGIAESSLEIDGGRISREAWISNPAGIAVYEIVSSMPISFTVRYSGANAYAEADSGVNKNESAVTYDKNAGIHFTAKALEAMHCDKKCGVNLYGCIGIKTDGTVESADNWEKGIHKDGNKVINKNEMKDNIKNNLKTDIEKRSVSGRESLKVSGSKRTVLYLTMETDFDMEQGRRDSGEYRQTAEARLAAAMEREIASLKEEHILDVKRNMEKCILSVEGEEAEIAKIPLLFQYGRYLLLSSSRKDSKLPAHLQGVWNDNVACRIGWTCDMHLDINTQMNYWPAELTGLAECSEPLFSWITNVLVPHGRKSAKDYYGLSGWTAELVSNAWGFTDPYWAVPLAPCPTGGIWILTHMWEHYLYTLNRSFLQDKVLQTVEEAVRFFADYMFLSQDGYYMGGPSISPENSFTVNGERLQLSNGCTYEIIMVRQLFAIYNEIYQILPHKCDGKLYSKIQDMDAKLLPYRILKDGTIAEWAHDYPAADKQHRHTSHLLGLFPFAQITKEETPYLAMAARKTIAEKLRPKEEWEDTGWARSMLMLYEARLGNGDAAYDHMKKMTENLLSSNYFVMHPPTRGAASFDDVYELDGNTGFTTCVAEMLLQSHNGCIRLLPALPAAWKSGSVNGLYARGGITVTIVWKEGKLINAVFCAEKNCKMKVSYMEKTREIQLKKGQEYNFIPICLAEFPTV